MAQLYWDQDLGQWVAQFPDGYERILTSGCKEQAQQMLEMILEDEEVLVDEC